MSTEVSIMLVKRGYIFRKIVDKTATGEINRIWGWALFKHWWWCCHLSIHQRVCGGCWRSWTIENGNVMWNVMWMIPSYEMAYHDKVRQLNLLYFCGICQMIPVNLWPNPAQGCNHQSTCMTPLQPLYSAALVPNVLPRRDEDSGEPCAVIESS